MRTSRIAVCLLSAALLFSSCDSSASSNDGSEGQTPVERHGQLRVDGNRIVDEHGEPVVLRGMSLFWSQWMGKYYNGPAVRWLRDDWHVTVVRAALAVDEGGYLEHPEAERQKLESVIDAAILFGIYVIVDWHAHDPHPEEAAEFFASIAAKYGDKPNIIYETWNEPLNSHDWNAVIKPYHERVIPRIREHDPDNLIVAGTQSWSQDVDKAAANPLAFENVAYALHFYASTHRQSLRNKASVALSNGLALVVTEWGTSEATGDGNLDRAEVGRWIEFMEENQLSWCNWSIADKEETSAALRPGARSTGNWSEDDLTPSGILVRNELRARNPEP
ncbi:MAG TPA: glycoside hydrolase family 5 protein [Rhodothermales bacterium]